MADIPYKIILEGITGSRAYGLDGPESDEDRRGVYVAPTRAMLGLRKPKEVYDLREPDACFYEIEKFMRLALKSNPNILEMLWLPEYTTLTAVGQVLVDLRQSFLSRAVYDSYGGYALSQAHKLNARTYSDFGPHRRQEKHARHCFRLLQQGRELLATGDLTVRVANREELLAIGKLPVDQLLRRFEGEYRLFKATSCCLPDEPDYEAVDRALLQIRDDSWLREWGSLPSSADVDRFYLESDEAEA